MRSAGGGAPDDVGAEEVPGAADGLVRVVDPDVAAPDDLQPSLAQGRDHRRRLRVVQADDVAVLHLRAERGAVGAQRRLVKLSLLLAELAAVGIAVEVGRRRRRGQSS
jgi:hypothetical protein